MIFMNQIIPVLCPIVNIENIVTTMTGNFVIGRECLLRENVYTSPCNSSELGIYLVSKSGPLQQFNITDVVLKYVKISYKDKYVVFPLIHLY
ncbi:hypothetical protein NQ314_012465 [Rhamnusium bicolor]|uniref:Uncharacterized protein n=1 Tax=Rhamnusium bicolor TaxID=1586634 RepID=A0AAV8XCG4_9CUCU|nr:hypothetical protein NQ314_012465 [Rhamnusium bicolor]